MKKHTPYIFLAISVLLAISAVVLLITKPGNSVPEPETTSLADTEQDTEPATPERIETLDEPIAPEPPETVLNDIGIGLTAATPEELLERISDALHERDMETVSKLVADKAFDADGFERLSKLARKQGTGAGPNGRIREVGEITLNRLSRWELEFGSDGDENERIYFEVARDGNQWRVSKVILPDDLGQKDGRGLLSDPLGIADSFLQAALKQDFETALQYVDKTSVTEAKIAGLCILFEEGNYQLRSSKPLRAMFTRDDIVGFIANLTTADGEENAQISISLRKESEAGNWKVSEINLDRLLSEYAKRLGGEEVYYSPLVKNPSGGETLALYFEFDEDSINPRTQRQLEIVTSMLKTDPAKKITLSGHTDSVGSEAYNDDLSAKRAQVVRDFLTAAGVSAEQIVTVAKGASQPRRPNVTETGEDNPEGRRANRRTEIYLDF